MCILDIQFILVLMIGQTQVLLRRVRAESVSLTVEGGVSLVGPHCHGTVRLFCEGVDLTTLTWMYNGDIDISDSYHPDSFITTPTNTSNPAFVSVQLTAVSQSSLIIFANYSSILTVDLSQLEQQNIMSVSCGDPGIKRMIPVDVHIIQDSVPTDPQLTEISIQLASLLKSNDAQFNMTVFVVSISWMQLSPVRCSYTCAKLLKLSFI